MKSLNPSYVHYFVKSAKASLDKCTSYKDIVPFANRLNEKANELLARALLNKTMDIQKLQRELFETGREFIRNFVGKFHNNSSVHTIHENLVEKKYDPGL